jgi:hypothetical protein
MNRHFVILRGFTALHLIVYIQLQTAKPHRYSKHPNVQARAEDDKCPPRPAKWSTSPWEARTFSLLTPSSIGVEHNVTRPTHSRLCGTLKNISSASEILQPLSAFSTEFEQSVEKTGFNASEELCLGVDHFNDLLDGFLDQALRGKATYQDCDFLIGQVSENLDRLFGFLVDKYLQMDALEVIPNSATFRNIFFSPSDFTKEIIELRNQFMCRKLLDITFCLVKSGQARLSDAESIIANMYRYDLFPDIGIFR